MLATARASAPEAHADELRPASPDEEFTLVYRRLFDRSMRLAYRMTRDAGGAEDVAAEALARAYSRWNVVRRMDQPDAWVMRVTVNLVIDAARRRKLLSVAMPSLAAPPEESAAFEEQIAIRRALVAALATLPKRQREAIALRYLAELDEEDISKSLNISPSSVRTHVQRGLASLREHLGASVEGSLRAAF
jgi:RNA polymerase sigma-70 factor (sigma-E family)